MKVLVLHSELGVLCGGGENFTRNLFTAFAARGHQVAAAFVADHKSRYPFPLPPSIEPIPIPGWWSRNLGQPLLSSLRRCISSQQKLRQKWDHLQEAVSWRTIRSHDSRFQRRIEREFSHRWNDYDVVYTHANAVLASRIASYRPTILRLPGPAAAERAPILRAVPVVCANGDALARIRGFLGDHAVELPIGVDTCSFSPEGSSVRASLGWTGRDLVVGYVGRLTHLKGIDLLVDAFREVLRTASNARLLVLGSGAEESYLRERLAKGVADGVVRLVPSVNHEDLPSWYRAMDLFVMPSRYENFSNAVLEAMACGIPVLASNIGGNRMLAKACAGRLFEPESIVSLSMNMRGLLENSSELKALGNAGRMYALDCCSWGVCAKRLEEIIIARLNVRA